MSAPIRGRRTPGIAALILGLGSNSIHVFKSRRLLCRAAVPNMATCFIVQERRGSYVTAHEVFDHDVFGVLHLGRVASAGGSISTRAEVRRVVADRVIHERLRHRVDYGVVLQ